MSDLRAALIAATLGLGLGCVPTLSPAQTAPPAPAPAGPVQGAATPRSQAAPPPADAIVPPIRRSMSKAGPAPASVKAVAAPAAKRCATGKTWNAGAQTCVAKPAKAKTRRGKAR